MKKSIIKKFNTFSIQMHFFHFFNWNNAYYVQTMFSSKNSTQLTGTQTTVDTFHTVLRMPAPSGIPCDASLRNSLILITFFEICIQQKAIINDPKYKQRKTRIMWDNVCDRPITTIDRISILTRATEINGFQETWCGNKLSANCHSITNFYQLVSVWSDYVSKTCYCSINA